MDCEAKFRLNARISFGVCADCMWHVAFFYDKGEYLRKRYEALKAELRRRGINFNEDSPLDPDGMFVTYDCLANDYIPTREALAIVRQRIAEKIAMKPEWYRHSGKAGIL